MIAERTAGAAPRPERPFRERLLLVAAAWAVALVATTLLAPYLARANFVFFWIAILFAAWYAGFVAALAASLSAVLAVHLLRLPSDLPFGAVGLGELLTFGIFVAASGLVSALTARTALIARRLRDSEGHFRSIAEAAPVGIIMSTPQHDATYVNPRAVEITGLAPRDITLQRWRMLVHPEDRDAVMTAGTALRDGTLDEQTLEFRIVRPDGEQRHVRAIQRWRFGASGERLGMVMILDDISREYMLETRLQQAQKLEAIGQLAGGIAHDFNNVLTVITGNLDFVRGSLPADDASQADLAEIESAAERARLLVRQLLAFSRRQVMQPQQVDVGGALRQAERWFTRVLGDEIRVSIDVVDRGQPLTVRVDPTQLDQVLINLAVNARDAMLAPRAGQARGGVLKLSAEPFALTARDSMEWAPLQPGKYVRLVVRDSGRGMDAETMSRAFEPFFTTKSVGEGTGLGLATVEGIIAQSGGAVRVESTIGVGTCFTILLPCDTGIDADPSAGNVRAFTERRARPSGVVLLAEDEEGVRRMSRRILERAGYEVEEATTGEQALALLMASDRDVVALVTDVRMPGMNGFELAARLREERPGLPAVYMTGFSDAPDEPDGPGDELLEKPFTSEELTRAVRNVTWRAKQPAG